MGKRGVDVVPESAGLILSDVHFASIVAGIRQGHIVYNNSRKVIFLLSGMLWGARAIHIAALYTPVPVVALQFAPVTQAQGTGLPQVNVDARGISCGTSDNRS